MKPPRIREKSRITRISPPRIRDVYPSTTQWDEDAFSHEPTKLEMTSNGVKMELLGGVHAATFEDRSIM